MPKIKLDKETVYGLCNSLNACLHGVRETHPQVADYMLRAEGTIFALYDKVNERKVILVSDIDPIMPSYNVADEHGRTIGEKSELFGYLSELLGITFRISGIWRSSSRPSIRVMVPGRSRVKRMASLCLK